MADINKLLAEEIVLELDGLKTIEIGSNEAATAVDNICKLNKMLQEDKKIEYDLDDKIFRRDLEKEKMQIEKEKMQIEKEKMQIDLDDKVSRRDLEKEKMQIDLDDKVSRRDLEKEKMQIEKEKMQIESDEKSKSDKKEFIIKSIGFGIQLVGIVLPAVLYGNWMKRGFEFEQTGTIASKTFLGLTQKLKPTS